MTYLGLVFGVGLVTKLCLTLCDLMDYSLPGSSVHGILQARILEWVAISFSRGSSQPRDQTWVSCIAGRFFTNWAMREAHSYCIFFIMTSSILHLGGTSGKESAYQCRDVDLILVLVRSPEVENGSLLWYLCLGNPMDRAVWWATVLRFAKSWTRLSTHTHE